MRFLKYGGYLVLTLLLAVAALLLYVKAALPNVGEAPALTLEYTAERIQRGEYLANHVTVCMDCHSSRDWSRFSGPLVHGTLGKGGEVFDQRVGMPGKFVSRNITPEGIGRYTDGELFRVITTGVTKEGQAMFPLMPYTYYGRMDPEDVYSIIAYIRSLAPIHNDVPPSVSDFPMNFIIHTLPQPAAHQQRPDPKEVLAYGAYLVNAAGCVECHTQVEKGQIVRELSFSGGREFPFIDGSVVRSSNLTPDKETGLGSWTAEMFVDKFKAYGDPAVIAEPLPAGSFNSWMPWTMYAGMTREDLTAIFTYLQSLPPMTNKVERFTPAGEAAH